VIGRMMKKLLLPILGLSFLCSIAVEAAITGPAFESLSRAADADNANLSFVFDGAIPTETNDVQTDSFQHRNTLSGNLVYGTPQYENSNARIPPPIINTKAFGELALADTEKTIIDKALNTLSSTSCGKSLVAFLKAEGVEIKWAPLSSISDEPDYAHACQPEECGKKKTIYLNNLKDYKDLFLASNPTFLAVTLAHELTHLVDFKNIGSGVQIKTSAHLYLELNGWSTGVYVYHELLKAGIAPKPGSWGYDSNRHIQMLRLDLAIRDYVNGGKRPAQKDFPAILSMNWLIFDGYITAVTKQQRKGSMSLAGVVELTYSLDSSLENYAKPALYDYSGIQEYNKYDKLKTSLGIRTADYLHWKEANHIIDAPNSNPSNNLPTPGGYQDGPGIGTDDPPNGYNPHFQDGI